MTFKFSNVATATLASSLTSSATSVTVATGLGALFPSLLVGQKYAAVIVDSSNNYEFVLVTARSGDVMTITRAQEGTAARSFSSGSRIELRLTAAALNNFVQLGTANTFTGDNTFTGANTFTQDIAGKTTNAYLADKASTLANGGGSGTAMTFNWSALSSQPTYIWGGEDGSLNKPFLSANLSVANAAKLMTGKWEVLESGDNLVFKFNGTLVMYVTSAGAIVTKSDITAYGI